MAAQIYPTVSYTFSLITQGKFKFYSLTLPSKVLAQTCFVSTRYEDPVEGFQRVLNEERAIQIAAYIDSGKTTIPTSIILSAQEGAQLKVKKGGRALTFSLHPKAFLILDGQHRVYGFSKAKSDLRVPVIIYNDLSREQETRLFIDINTKQKPVPNELLLDIKHLADIELDIEKRMRVIFDIFNSDQSSVLKGLLSASERVSGKLSRVSFNSACKGILPILADRDTNEIFEIINSYLTAFISGLVELGYEEIVYTPYGFKAILSFFPEVAARVKGQFSGDYTTDNFADVLDDMFENITKQQLYSARNNAKAMQDLYSRGLSRGFKL